MPSQFGDPEKAKLATQADQIWNMLDEMAKSDPQAYRKFIEKQLSEGKKAMKPPDPHMCIQTSIVGHHGVSENLFINILQWSRIPAPKTDEDPIPVVGGPIYRVQENNISHKVVCLAFNDDILNKYGRQSKLSEERDMLVNLGLDFLEDQRNLTVSRSYVVLSKFDCKGPLQKARESLMTKTQHESEQFEDQLTELEQTLGPVAAGCKTQLLQELSQSNATPESHISIHSTSEQRSGMIEEISSTDVPLAFPAHNIATIEVSGIRSLVLKIELPGVTCVSDCELDLSENDVQLDVKDMYKLNLQLPEKVNDVDAKAKFNKKSSTLTLTLPTQHTTPAT